MPPGLLNWSYFLPGPRNAPFLQLRHYEREPEEEVLYEAQLRQQELERQRSASANSGGVISTTTPVYYNPATQQATETRPVTTTQATTPAAAVTNTDYLADLSKPLFRLGSFDVTAWHLIAVGAGLLLLHKGQ